MNVKHPKGEFINISRRLTLEGWDYYKKVGMKYSLISKREYLAVKKANTIYMEKLKDFRRKLRGS